MPTITYRQLGPNNDPIWGNYISDTDAVAQAVLTRLNLLQGEWWESLTEGTPLWQSILGVSGARSRQQPISLLLQQRILGTLYVTGISNVQTSFSTVTRAFTFYAVVQTRFGNFTISTNIPTPVIKSLP